MVQVSTLFVLVICVFFASALPARSRVRRGFNKSGYGRGDGYFGQGSNERDASVSHENHEHGNGCGSEESNESQETSYGIDEYNQNERNHGGRRPPR